MILSRTFGKHFFEQHPAYKYYSQIWLMEIGKVEEHINGKIASGRGVFMGIIDPDKNHA